MSTRPNAETADTPLDGEIPTESKPRRRWRRAVIGVVVLGIVAAATIVAVPLFTEANTADPKGAQTTAISTVPVTTGNMVSATNARATLHYANEAPLLAGPSGVVTALPPTGTVVAPGGILYEVDNQPVVLLRGSLPAWRTFEVGMSDGEDVLQLEQNLIELGIPFSGDVDMIFTAATKAAVSAWQKELGVERTGELDRAAILFTDHDLRVARHTATRGTVVAAGAELYQVSSTDKVVDLDLRMADQQLAVIGNEVGITLPDGSATTGLIAAVGEPLERAAKDEDAKDSSSAASASFVLPVTVTLTDQAAVAAFPRASVTVQFASTLAEDVLTVPVEALVASGPDSFAVETPDSAGEALVRRLPVTIGAFASGRVQISGTDIREGLKVVVPES